jgi:hypothetical protein
MRPQQMPYVTQNKARRYYATSLQSLKTMNHFLLPRKDGDLTNRAAMAGRCRNGLYPIVHDRIYMGRSEHLLT